MSYNTWHTYGYGVRTDDIKVKSVKAIEKLLAKAPEFQKMVHTYFAVCEITCPTIQDYLDFEDESYYSGIGYLLRKVILEAAGIELVECDNFDGEHFLLFTPGYPWYFKGNPKAHRMTEEKLNALFRRYIKIVTDNPPTPDYQEVENGG